VGRGPTFEEVLDAALHSGELEGSGAPGIRWPVEPQAPLFMFVRAPVQSPSNGRMARVPLVAAAGLHVRAAVVQKGPPGSAPPPPRSRRPVRHLPLRHQLALDALADLGANLRPDFTLPELRSAFRTLARRYHPDRHAVSDGDEQHRRARLFAAATDHYHCLLEVVRPRL
jgi:hypothetical protein